MKKTVITLIVCAALVVGGFFGAKAVINRERAAHAEDIQAKSVQTEAPQTEAPQTDASHSQQSEKTEIIWYHPSDENDSLDLSNLSDAEADAVMNAQTDAIKAAEAFDRAVENELPKGMHYPDWFGGSWIGKDNKLHLAFARCASEAARELTEKALSAYSHTVFYEQDMPYSYNELESRCGEIFDHLREKGFKVTGINVDERFNRIELSVLPEDLEAVEAYRAELEALFPYPMVIEEGYYFQAQ